MWRSTTCGQICSLAKGCNPTSLNCVNLTFKGMPLKPLPYFMSVISYKEAYLKLDQKYKAWRGSCVVWMLKITPSHKTLLGDWSEAAAGQGCRSFRGCRPIDGNPVHLSLGRQHLKFRQSSGDCWHLGQGEIMHDNRERQQKGGVRFHLTVWQGINPTEVCRNGGIVLGRAPCLVLSTHVFAWGWGCDSWLLSLL